MKKILLVSFMMFLFIFLFFAVPIKIYAWSGSIGYQEVDKINTVYNCDCLVWSDYAQTLTVKTWEDGAGEIFYEESFVVSTGEGESVYLHIVLDGKSDENYQVYYQPFADNIFYIDDIVCIEVENEKSPEQIFQEQILSFLLGALVMLAFALAFSARIF